MLPFELTKDTPYLALSGELWSVFYEYFNKNWPCYKGFLLYIPSHLGWRLWDSGLCLSHWVTIVALWFHMASNNLVNIGSGNGLVQLVQVMACQPSSYLNKYWFVINKDLWYSPECNFMRNAQNIIFQMSLKITHLTSQPHPRGQGVVWPDGHHLGASWHGCMR